MMSYGNWREAMQHQKSLTAVFQFSYLSCVTSCQHGHEKRIDEMTDGNEGETGCSKSEAMCQQATFDVSANLSQASLAATNCILSDLSDLSNFLDLTILVFTTSPCIVL